MDLSLRYEPNGRAHNDIFLRFAGQTYVCDSYYFALDRGLQEGDESDAKIIAVLCRLLEQWLAAVKDLADGDTAFLPFDFSDQSTGWLSCRRKGNEIVVSRGWALVHGYWFFPSAIGDYLNHLPDFKVDGPTIYSTREELLRAIKRSLAEAISSGSHYPAHPL